MFFSKLILNFFYPKYCLLCEKPKGRYLCKDCFGSKFRISMIQKCHICGKEVRSGYMHAECKESSFLDGLIHVVTYDDNVKIVVEEGKYFGNYEVFNEIGQIMGEYLNSYFNFKDYLISFIPLSDFKFNKRGFNQAELLAKSIAKINKLDVEKTLKRIKKTKTQVGMNKEQRSSNLKNAFEINSDASGRKILLIDDIYTTGTTLNECAKILMENGAESVVGFSFAKARA